MYELAARLDERRTEAIARATFAEMALAGITLAGEFHYIHHDRDGRPDHLTRGAITRAAADAGSA